MSGPFEFNDVALRIFNVDRWAVTLRAIVLLNIPYRDPFRFEMRPEFGNIEWLDA
jgi:hypothetical protein